MKHFLNLESLSLEELKGILEEALILKKIKAPSNDLEGKFLALIFEKASTRTRVSFEVAMNQLGGQCSFFSPTDLQLGRGEPIEDTARVVSSMVDGVVLRTLSHKTITTFSGKSSVPVINGLSDLSHPCQLLADLMTFIEIKGDISGANVTWVGDYNNMCLSYIEASKIFKFNLEVVCPKNYWPSSDQINDLKIVFTEDIKSSINNSDLVSTDVWVSMGDEKEQSKRIADFQNFQVSPELMSTAKEQAIFLHCLPAIRGQEISNDMLEDSRSKVWVQAENRLHVQKSLLKFLI